MADTSETRGATAKGPQSTEAGPAAASGNASGQGFRLHDAGGPRLYRPAAGDLSDRLTAVLQARHPGLSCVIEEEKLILTGTVGTAREAREAQILLEEAEPGMTVVNRLQISAGGPDA